MFDYVTILPTVVFSLLGFPVFIFTSLIKFRSTGLKIFFISLAITFAASSIYLLVKLPIAMILWAYVASAFGLIGAVGLSFIRKAKKLDGGTKTLDTNIVRRCITFFGSTPLIIGFALSTGIAIFYSLIMMLLGLYAFTEYVDSIKAFLYIMSIILIFIAIFFLASE